MLVILPLCAPDVKQNLIVDCLSCLHFVGDGLRSSRREIMPELFASSASSKAPNY
jgi:hypothetical protein